MAITTKPLEASQDFIDGLSPKKSLRTWLKQALADDDLALFFMYTDPPSKEECRYGVQFIDTTTLPLTPRAYESKTSGYFLYHYRGTPFMGFTDAATLLSTEWLEDFEKVNQLNGTNIEHDGASTLTLVPRADTRLHPTAIRYNIPYTRAGVAVADTWKMRPYKWAVLARKSAFNPRLRSWHSGSSSNTYRAAYYNAFELLFDFRGGIPLTVGTVGSEADVWLGEQLSYIDPQHGRQYEYPSSVEIGRIHVPILGDSSHVS